MAEIVLPNPSQFFDKVFEDNLKERKIILNTEISQDVIEMCVLQIMKYNAEDKGKPVEERVPIKIYINSLGGDVYSGMAIVSAIKSSKTPIIGVILAYGYSMGGVIFAASHKRYMFEYSTLLIHDGSMVLAGSSGKVKDLQKFYEQTDDKIKDIIVSNSNITSEEYDENADRELYFFAHQCKEKGLCDGIIGEDIDLDEIL